MDVADHPLSSLLRNRLDVAGLRTVLQRTRLGCGDIGLAPVLLVLLKVCSTSVRNVAGCKDARVIVSIKSARALGTIIFFRHG